MTWSTPEEEEAQINRQAYTQGDEFQRNLKALWDLNSRRRWTPEDVGFGEQKRLVSAWLINYSDGVREIALCDPGMSVRDVLHMGCLDRPGTDFHVQQISVAGFRLLDVGDRFHAYMPDGRRLGRDGFMRGVFDD